MAECQHKWQMLSPKDHKNTGYFKHKGVYQGSYEIFGRPGLLQNLGSNF